MKGWSETCRFVFLIVFSPSQNASSFLFGRMLFVLLICIALAAYSSVIDEIQLVVHLQRS